MTQVVLAFLGGIAGGWLGMTLVGWIEGRQRVREFQRVTEEINSRPVPGGEPA